MIEQINNVSGSWWAWMWPMFWQVGLLIVLIGLVDLLIRRRVWPQVRYALWLLVLIKLVLPPSLALPTSLTSPLGPLAKGIIWHQPLSDQTDMVGIEQSAPAMPPVSIEPTIAVGPETVPMGMAPSNPSPAIAADSVRLIGPTLIWQAYSMLAWLLGVLVLAGWLVVRFWQLRRTHQAKTATGEHPQWFNQLLAGTAKKLRLRRLPQVVLSPTAASPAVFGVLRPVLLIPAEDINHLSRTEIEHIFLHELAHIKRGDLIVHAFNMLLQIIYWPNPLLWLVRRQLQHLRELCCDASVARILRAKTADYKETILETARRMLAKPIGPGMGLLGLFENANRLGARLKWLDKKSWKHRPLRIATILAVVGLMCACVLPMAQGKNKDTSSAVNNESGLQMPSILSDQEILGIPPEKAVVIDPQLPWKSSSWAGHDDTALIAMEEEKDRPRFIVAQAGRRHVWIYYLAIPFDPQHYPIAVLTYRARNTNPDSADYYGLWIDDTTGPNRDNIYPFVSNDFIPDGQVRELRKDLRTLNPKGEITGLALGVNCGKQSPAEFELIGLRFEADPDSRQARPIRLGSPVSIRVVDQAGKPVEGATVTVDAERANWSRSTTTDKDGRASVTPLANNFAKHMLRISKAGMASVELGGYRYKGPLPEQITLKRALRYGGVVRNEQSEPIAGTAVDILIPQRRRRINVFTDAEGRWQTPPLPDDLEGLMVRMAHPDYIFQSNHSAAADLPIDQLQDRTAVMTLRRGIPVSGIVVDKDGNPVSDARVRQGPVAWGLEHPFTYTDKEGRFHFPSTEPGEMILTVQKTGFAPQMARLQARRDMEPLRFIVKKGQTILGRVVDAQDRPIVSARVSVFTWGNYRTINWNTTTNSEGRFTWTDAPANEVGFWIGKQGYVWTNVHLAPSEKEQVITLTQKLGLLRSLRSMGSFVVGVAKPNPAN